MPCPGRFTAGEGSGTHCIGASCRSGRVRKISSPLGFKSMSVQPVNELLYDYEIPTAWCNLLVSLKTIITHQRAYRLLMRPVQVPGLKPYKLYYYYYYYYYYDNGDSNEHHAYASRILISEHSYGKTRNFGNGKTNKGWKICPFS
jgi:hypothetical protein